MLNNGLKMYYINNSPKHSIEYTQECFDFFKNYKNDSENTIMPENIKKLRELQMNDLLYFYDNLILESFWIQSEIKNNKYYYNMIILVKKDFNLENFLKINFNTINIESITPIFYNNITYSYIQQLFDFKKLNSYAFYGILDASYDDIIFNPKRKTTKEYLDFEKYKDEQIKLKNFNTMQHKNSLYWKYRNNYNGAVSEIINQRELFKHYFSIFGYQWFILNYNFEDQYEVQAFDYTYPVNEPFLLTLEGLVQPIAILTQNGEIKKIDYNYDFGSMFELLMNLNSYENYCIGSYNISVPKINYNTSYKCRLNKKK